MKNRAAKDEDLHTGPTFVHVFCSNFATFRVSVSSLNFQKSTPNFQKALTFENRGTPFFEKQAQVTDFQRFRKSSKYSRFFAKKVVRAEFSKYEG